MHSFALTDRSIVLAEFPLVVRFSQLVAGKPFMASFAWRPERGTSFLVIDRRDGSVRGRWQGPPLFAFHHVNAFEQDDRLVIDLCAYEDDAIIRELFLEGLRAGTATVPDATLRRCTIDLAGGVGVTVETISDVPFELPRINYGAVNGRPYRYAYGAARRPGAGPHEWISRLVKIDVGDGSASAWSADGCSPGEPVFVAAPSRAGEDDGVCLSVVLDTRRGTSFLLVLDAGSFQELARAEVPHQIPYGFHGQFVRAG
jgi:carotenoid cleavage dioxygenase-like enzyme